MIVVKRIIRYINGTLELGLWYSKDTNIILAVFSDSDSVGDASDRKSITRDCKLYISAKFEYIAAGSCYTQLLWMK